MVMSTNNDEEDNWLVSREVEEIKDNCYVDKDGYDHDHPDISG